MTDDDVLKAACCLAGTDSEVTVEELVLLKRLVGSAGLNFDALIAKASRDDDFRQNRIETVTGAPDDAMERLIRLVREGGSIEQGHMTILLWRVGTKIGLSPERFEQLLGAAESS